MKKEEKIKKEEKMKKEEKIKKIIDMFKNKNIIQVFEQDFKNILISMVDNNDAEMSWYGHFFLKFELKIVTDIKAPAGIGFYNSKYYLFINPYYMEMIPNNEKIAIIKHEIMHVIYLHNILFTEEKGYKHELANIAQDIVINGCEKHPNIKYLPGSDGTSKFISVIFYQYLDSLIEKKLLKKYKKNKDTKYYYQLLNDDKIKEELNKDFNMNKNCNNSMNITDEQLDEILKNLKNNKTLENGGKDFGTYNGPKIELNDEQRKKIEDFLKNGNIPMDDHDYKNEELEKQKTSMKLNEKNKLAVLEKMLNETNKEINHKYRGFSPSEATDCLLKINELKSQVNWKNELKRFVGIEMSKIQKEMRIGYTHPIYFKNPNIPGYKKLPQPTIVTIADISGSMSDKELIYGINEIKTIAKKFDINSLLLQVDTEVKQVENITQDQLTINRKGNGGTIMERGFEFIYDSKNRIQAPNMIVVITDGGVEKSFHSFELPKNVKVIWLSTNKLYFDISKYNSKQMKEIRLKLDDEI